MRRFRFGKNWSSFLAHLTEERVLGAANALTSMLGLERLDGSSFLDVGSGSGLSSLAARRRGATVVSFDIDEESVACTASLRDRYFGDDVNWQVVQGSAIDRRFLSTLGTFDIVYSWGVLHHTGRMGEALENVIPLVRPGGLLFLSIYNDQGRRSRLWRRVKLTYNLLPRPFRFVVLLPVAVWAWAPAMLRDFVTLRPFATWRRYGRNRGMSPWHDVVDWVGGYPFEVAKPEEVIDHYLRHGFVLRKLKTCCGSAGCNEFVFAREGARP